jgi:hypothetical protein
VIESTNDFRAIRAGALTAALLALAEHIGLWGYRDRIPLAGRYTLGVAAIGTGMAVTCARRKDWRNFDAAVCSAGAAGMLIASLHWWRIQQGQPPEGEAAYWAGYAAGKAEARRGAA